MNNFLTDRQFVDILRILSGNRDIKLVDGVTPFYLGDLALINVNGNYKLMQYDSEIPAILALRSMDHLTEATDFNIASPELNIVNVGSGNTNTPKINIKELTYNGDSADESKGIISLNDIARLVNDKIINYMSTAKVGLSTEEVVAEIEKKINPLTASITTLVNNKIQNDLPVATDTVKGIINLNQVQTKVNEGIDAFNSRLTDSLNTIVTEKINNILKQKEDSEVEKTIESYLEDSNNILRGKKWL